MMRQEVCRLAKIADDEGGQGRHESIHVTASGCVGLPVFMLVGMTVRIVMTGFCGLSAMVVDERPRGGVQQEFEEHVRMGVRRPSPVRHGRADECEAERHAVLAKKKTPMIYPVLVGTCAWWHTWVEPFGVLPRSQQSIASITDTEERGRVWVEIIDTILDDHSRVGPHGCRVVGRDEASAESLRP